MARYSARQWQQWIEQQASSGQTQAAFCTSQGIGLSTFGRWKRRLANEPVPSTTASDPGLFTPLLDPATEDAAPETDTGWTIELDLGDGVCLRLRRGL